MSGQLPFKMSVMFLRGAGIASPHTTPNTFCLIQQEFAHDVAQLEYWAGNVNAQSLESGMPVWIMWGRPPLMRSFYGYVNHASRTNNWLAKDNVGRNATCITCVGASWPMKETGTTAYTNMTSTQIIQQIAAQFGLDCKVEPHPVIWPCKQQAGKSYWQFCAELAQEIGYTFFCNGIQLTAIPRTTDPQSLTNLAAVYDYKKNPASLPIFNPTLGANNPTGGQLRNRQLAAIDPRTGQVIYAAVSGSQTAATLGQGQEVPSFSETETVTVENQQQLNTKLQGSAQLNQLYLTASAHGVGQAQISQGHMILVRNANGSQNGLWFLTKVEHHMSSQNYTMDLQCGRDSIGAAANLSTVPATSLPPKATLASSTTWMAA